MSEKTLILRTCDKDGKAYGDFQWPTEAGAIVEAPDWNPKAVCGGGFHGLAWGKGDYGLLSSEHDALWYIVETETKSLVHIGGEKCKFPQCEIKYVGNSFGAIKLLMESIREQISATTGDAAIAACIGLNGKAKARNGVIVVSWYDEKAERHRVTVGYTNENGIKPDVWYRADENGNLVECEE